MGEEMGDMITCYLWGVEVMLWTMRGHLLHLTALGECLGWCNHKMISSYKITQIVLTLGSSTQKRMSCYYEPVALLWSQQGTRCRWMWWGVMQGCSLMITVITGETLQGPGVVGYGCGDAWTGTVIMTTILWLGPDCTAQYTGSWIQPAAPHCQRSETLPPARHTTNTTHLHLCHVHLHILNPCHVQHPDLYLLLFKL